MAFRAAQSNSSATSSVTVTAPTVSDGDILVAFASSWALGGAGNVAFPAGFTIWYTEVLETYGRLAVAWKRASSESGDYEMTSTSAAEMYAIVATFSGRVASGDPLDVGSDTAYVTDNTTVRGAGVTIATTGSDLIYCGICAPNDTPELAAPSGMTSRSSLDVSASWIGMELASLDNQGTGATGDKDGTADASCTYKHAFLLALKPAAAAGNPYYYFAQQ